VGTSQTLKLRFDTVIGAVGARVDTGRFAKNGLPLTSEGRPELNAANESPLGNVYVAGDCKAGAATVVKAIADSKTIALDILGKLKISHDIAAGIGMADPVAIQNAYYKKGVLVGAKADNSDAYRCLSCDSLCEICADVCPNRANVAIQVEGFALPNQIVHFDRMCNECGNCVSFCPHAGSPYKDKFTVFHTAEDFEHSENRGVLFCENGTVTVRLADNSIKNYQNDDGAIPGEYSKLITALMNRYSYML
jgi:putative selenate reductase